MMGPLPVPLGARELKRLWRAGELVAEPVMVRLWDQVPAITPHALTAFPGRDPREHDWSIVRGVDLAIHISDETAAEDYRALVESLTRAKAGTVFVIHHVRGCIAVVRHREPGRE